jgi:hypothetical protein
VATDAHLREAILRLLAARDPGRTICPSDAARAVAGEQFRPLMDATRRVAGELVQQGRIEITQKGVPVDLATVRGPIRLRLVPDPPGSDARVQVPQRRPGTPAP